MSRSSGDDDPLLYLPRSTIVEHRPAEIIYDTWHPCANIYAVMAGTVYISRRPEQGPPVIVDVCSTDDFIGEGALLRLPRRDERAVALEKAVLMKWSCAEIEDLMERRPGLAMAFLRMVTRREIEFCERLESLSRDSIAVRLAGSLLRFSERLGKPLEDGGVRMRSFTHAFFAQYLGTSRELVNTCMTQFRRQELLTYSRREIIVRPAALREWTKKNP